jgi:hypothetical protein
MKKKLLSAKKKNRMRRLTYLLVAGVLSICCCNRDHTTSTPDELDAEESVELAHLKGTKWKLEGIVDVETGVLEVVVPRKGTFAMVNGREELIDGEPIDCEKCYAFTFVTNTMAHGWSLMNSLSVSFFDSIQIGSTNIHFTQKPICGGTEIGEPPMPTRYTNALSNLTSYIYYNNELKLFYNSNKTYLLYKLAPQ